jgi:hypothetical protein
MCIYFRCFNGIWGISVFLNNMHMQWGILQYWEFRFGNGAKGAFGRAPRTASGLHPGGALTNSFLGRSNFVLILWSDSLKWTKGPAAEKTSFSLFTYLQREIHTIIQYQEFRFGNGAKGALGRAPRAASRLNPGGALTNSFLGYKWFCTDSVKWFSEMN